MTPKPGGRTPDFVGFLRDAATTTPPSALVLKLFAAVSASLSKRWSGREGTARPRRLERTGSEPRPLWRRRARSLLAIGEPDRSSRSGTASAAERNASASQRCPGQRHHPSALSRWVLSAVLFEKKHPPGDCQMGDHRTARSVKRTVPAQTTVPHTG